MLGRRLAIATLVVVALGSLGGKPGGPGRPQAAKPGRSAQLMMAQQQLKSGRYSQAIEMFEAILRSNPDHRRARLGIGTAYAAMGRCEDAARAFDPIRATKTFDERGYMMEGDCALGRGDASGAVERFEEAVAVAPRNETAWLQLMIARQEAGDAEGAVAALDELSWRDSEGLASALAQARLTLGTDEYPRARVELDAVTRDVPPTSSQVLAFHDARAQLLDGAPELAKETLLPLARGDLNNPVFAYWRAEACRRAGDLECAAFAVDRPAMQNTSPTPLAFAVRARVYADLGRIDDARAQLDAQPVPSDPEHVASAWYVARAAGEDTSRLEAVYAVLGRPDTGDLSLLIPRSAP